MSLSESLPIICEGILFLQLTNFPLISKSLPINLGGIFLCGGLLFLSILEDLRMNFACTWPVPFIYRFLYIHSNFEIYNDEYFIN